MPRCAAPKAWRVELRARQAPLTELIHETLANPRGAILAAANRRGFAA